MGEANELARALLPSLIAMVGGLIWQLYAVAELDKPFHPMGCVAYLVAAAGVGWAAGDLLREDFRGRVAIIMGAGTMPYLALAAMRKAAAKLFGQVGGAPPP